MKRIFLILIVIFCTNFYLQCQWNWYNPKPIAEFIYDIEFVTDDIGYACGSVGHIIKTINGGEHWYSIGSINDDYLLDISFVSVDKGWAFGYYSSVYKTENAGNSWTKLDINIENQRFQCGVFLNENKGILGCENGKIYLTNDGGIEWELVSSNTYKVHDIFFYDNQLGFAACDNGIILKTNNGGLTWTSYDTEASDYFESIYFTDENIGYVCGFQNFFKTTNGGISWERIKVCDDEISEYNFFDCCFINQNIGYMTSDLGNIFYTTDGGINWTISNPEPDLIFISVEVTNSGTIFIGADNGYIFKSEDNTNSWTLINETITNERLYSIDFINQSEGIACGTDGVLLKTSNGGFTWNVTYFGNQHNLTDVKYLSENKVIVTSSSGMVFISEDAGETWNSYNFPISLYPLKIEFVNETVGWVVGYYSSNGAICKTSDGGYTWESQNSGFGAYLYDLTFTSDTTGFIAAPYGTILKTTDGGENWISLNVGTEDDIWFSIDNIGTDTIHACGAYGKIASSFDAGQSWEISTVTSQQYWLKYIDLLDDGTGYCTGFSGVVLKTNDYGLTWVWAPRFTNLELHKIIRLDDFQLFVVGDNGAIVSNKIDPRNAMIVDNAILPISNLYPNPVNDYFTIIAEVEKYWIYDISGKIINSGEMKNNIDVRDLAEGVYLIKYKVINGNFEIAKFVVSHR